MRTGGGKREYKQVPMPKGCYHKIYRRYVTSPFLGLCNSSGMRGQSCKPGFCWEEAWNGEIALYLHGFVCVCVGLGCVITTEQDDKVVCQSDIGHAIPSAEPSRAR